MDPVAQLNISNCIFLVILAGATGGLMGAILKALTHIFENLPDYGDPTSMRAYQEMCDKMQSKQFYLGRAVVGVGGGFAAILAGTWMGKVKYTSDTENVLLLTALCVVAGTIAHKLVPGIGDRLQDELIRKQVKHVEKITEERVSQAEKTIEASQHYNVVISHADMAFSTQVPADVHLAIHELVSILKTHPLDRTAHIYLGRLYRLDKNYDAAITVLRSFIEHLDEEKTKGGLTAHIDLAAGAAYFNIACYHALKLREYKAGTHSAAEMSRLYNETLVALKRAIELDSENLTAAQTDADFKDMLDEDEVKKLLGMAV